MPIAKEKGGDFTPCEAGTWLARCFAVIGLGVQESANFPATNKVMLMFEIPEQMTERDGEELPMVINKEYTVSLNKKANLRKHLDAWRGKPFTPEELEGFELKNVLGAPALLTIVRKTSTTGKTYANIEAITRPMKGQVCAEQHHKSVGYDIENGKNDVYEKLPEWIQKKIANSEEWKNPGIKNEGTSQPDPEPPDDDVGF